MAEQKTAPAVTTAPAPKRNTVRSPAYPWLDLKTAIDRARKFYEHEKRSSANSAVAVGHWGYKPASSGGKQTLAALLAFGLMKGEGSLDKRRVTLTDSAFRIILDERPESAERDALIRAAAEAPKIHKEVLTKWPGLEVSDANLRHYLVVERQFNENGAQDFIKELRATAAFAKLTAKPQNGGAGERRDEEPKLVAVGNYVQWESNGVVQFEAERVVWVSDDGAYARVENSSTGLPVSELTVVEAPDPVAKPPGTPLMTDRLTPPPPPPARPGMKQDTFSFPTSEGLAVFQWPAQMTKEEFEDLEAWIEIKLRGIKRAIQ